MRLAFILLLTVFCGTVARGQDPDVQRKYFDSILYRKLNAPSPLQKKSFFGGKGFSDARGAETKTFYTGDGVATKQAGTRAYVDAKSFWGGKFQASTSEADGRNRRFLPDLGRIFSTKKAATREDRDSSKKFATGSGEVRTREYRGPETKEVERTYPNMVKQMTIQQVRELLNRN